MVRFFEDLYGTDDLVMELGGVFWGFAPEKYPNNCIPKSLDVNGFGGFLHWKEMWMHSDHGRKGGKAKFACTVQLEDAGMEDHSFVYMGGSLHHHDAFFAAHNTTMLENPERIKQTKDHFTQLTFEELAWFEERGCTWRKIAAPKGSLIIWDTRTIHSTGTFSKHLWCCLILYTYI